MVARASVDHQHGRLHGAGAEPVQGLLAGAGRMVLALQGADGCGALGEKSQKRNRDWLENPQGQQPKVFMADYGELLFRVQDESLMEGMPLVISGEENEHDLRPASRRDSRFELNADPVEPAPPRNATPAIAIHLQIEFVRETVGVAHKEQPSSR
jgi:hypothetical protein